MTGPTLWDEGTHLSTDSQVGHIKVPQRVTTTPTLYPLGWAGPSQGLELSSLEFTPKVEF